MTSSGQDRSKQSNNDTVEVADNSGFEDDIPF